MFHASHRVALALILIVPTASAQVTVESGFMVSQLVTGLDRPFAAAGPAANGYTGDLYVTTGANKEIVRIDLSGTVHPFADLSSLIPFDAAFWATFDILGNYGGELFVDDDHNTATDKVYRVSSTGAGSVFASAVGADNDALAFDPFGAFGGALFLHDGASLATVYRVDPAGAVTAFATSVNDFSAQITFSPGGAFGVSMYIAGEAPGKIYVVPSTHVPGQPATLFTGFQDNSPSVDAAGLAISDGGPFGTDVLLVNDTNTGSIVRIDVAGNTTGTLLQGLAGAAALELVRTGDFIGSLVLTDFGDGSLYVVTPVPDPWSNEGCALAGSAGEPLLAGTGTLEDGSLNQVDLTQALASAPAALFVGLQDTPTPFKGGTLKPVPFLALISLTTSGAGSVSLPFLMPTGVPVGTELWFQVGISDAGAVNGVALSNALLGTTP